MGSTGTTISTERSPSFVILRPRTRGVIFGAEMNRLVISSVARRVSTSQAKSKDLRGGGVRDKRRQEKGRASWAWIGGGRRPGALIAHFLLWRTEARALDIRWLSERALPRGDQLPENTVLVLRRAHRELPLVGYYRALPRGFGNTRVQHLVCFSATALSTYSFSFGVMALAQLHNRSFSRCARRFIRPCRRCETRNGEPICIAPLSPVVTG